MLRLRLAVALAIGITFIVDAGAPGSQSAQPLPVAAPVRSAATAGADADFGDEPASADARALAAWIADSRDHAGADFLIIDKKAAHLYVFDGDARLRSATAVLLGSAFGDASAPGIGAKPLLAVLPQERTTPAGRFVAERGRNLRGEDVVWVDYDAAVSIHRVINTKPEERRLQRLATTTAADNRISYGCINVPVAFYEQAVRPIFAQRRAIVYVLPDILSLQQVFDGYASTGRQRRPSAPTWTASGCADLAACAGLSPAKPGAGESSRTAPP